MYLFIYKFIYGTRGNQFVFKTTSALGIRYILNHGQRQAEAVCLTAARCHCIAAPIETRCRMTRLSPNFFSDNYPIQRWVQKSHKP